MKQEDIRTRHWIWHLSMCSLPCWAHVYLTEYPWLPSMSVGCKEPRNMYKEIRWVSNIWCSMWSSKRNSKLLYGFKHKRKVFSLINKVKQIFSNIFLLVSNLFIGEHFFFFSFSETDYPMLNYSQPLILHF